MNKVSQCQPWRQLQQAGHPSLQDTTKPAEEVSEALVQQASLHTSCTSLVLQQQRKAGGLDTSALHSSAYAGGSHTLKQPAPACFSDCNEAFTWQWPQHTFAFLEQMSLNKAGDRLVSWTSCEEDHGAQVLLHLLKIKTRMLFFREKHLKG